MLEKVSTPGKQLTASKGEEEAEGLYGEEAEKEQEEEEEEEEEDKRGEDNADFEGESEVERDNRWAPASQSWSSESVFEPKSSEGGGN